MLRTYKLFITISIIIILAVSASFGLAASVEELKQKSSGLSEQIKKLDEEIKTISKQLLTTGAEKKTLNSELAKIETTRKKLVSELSLTAKKIELTNNNIVQIQSDIGVKQHDIEKNKTSIAETVRNLRQKETSNFFELLLGGAMLSDFITQTENLISLQSRLDEAVQSLKQNKNILEGKKIAKETEKKTLTGLKEQLSGQKQVTEEIKKEKNQLLTDTKNKESNYQKMLADRLAKKKAVEAEIADVEQQIKIAIDPSLLPKTGSGILLWPTDKVIITQFFGNTAFASTHTILYGGKGHNGIDLGVPVGTTIKSASDGKVIGAGDTDVTCKGASYGKWILIQHTNGLSTLYGHLSVIRVTEGQSVYAGQPIAFSGNTGYSTGPHLHFTVYASQGVKVSSLQSKACGGVYRLPIASYNSYLNPLAYLPPK